MSLCILLNETPPHVTKLNPTFITALLKCSSKMKEAASHISTIHNSQAEVPCQQGHQNTGNALSKRHAHRCRPFSSHWGFRRFHQHHSQAQEYRYTFCMEEKHLDRLWWSETICISQRSENTTVHTAGTLRN